ncbi:DUF3501 family protein [Myxococcota bacterium]|nr:DUF3501 family protein [Myxococcota bacterium]
MVPPLAPLGLDDILPLDRYLALRSTYLQEMLRYKDDRRISLGGCLSLTFECRETVLCQVHEILALEYAHRPHRIGEELAGYACLVPRPGELTLTAFVDGGPPAQGRTLARALAQVPGTLSLHLDSHSIAAEPAAPTPDPADPVHYLRIPVGDRDLSTARLVLSLGARTWHAPLPRGLRPACTSAPCPRLLHLAAARRQAPG